MAAKLIVGDKIPQFLVKDHAGYDVRNTDVIGVPLVIYFYPKDSTPTCTKEACFFRDSMRKFDELQVLVLGVSPDSVESHKKFIGKTHLPFSLLSDTKKEMCQAFGVLKEGKVVRTTFVVNGRGIVQWVERHVDVEGHVERVIKALETHCAKELGRYTTFEKDYADLLKSGPNLTEEEKEKRKKILKEYGLEDK